MSTPLETAKQKLTVIEFDYDNLPTEDNATLWVDIRNEAKLSLNEFAALKKERCLAPATAATGGYEELSLAVRALQNNEALRGDKRLFFFGPAADSSHGNHSVADGIIDDWYGKKCVICGADCATRAHIVSGRVTTDFESFGPPTYSDALDVKSHRNFIPLCGTLGDKGSCHDAFDKFLITIVYNEIAGKYVCYCIAPVKEFTRRDQVHLKELNMHSDHQPYKRLLAWRTRKSFIEHSYWVSGEDVGNLVGIVDLSETASTKPAQDR